MRPLRALAVLSLCGLLLGGCAAPRPRPADTYVVVAGDTLYSIAWRHDLDYRELARLNHIGPDYRISVGQLLTLDAANPPGNHAAAHASSAAHPNSAPRPATPTPPGGARRGDGAAPPPTNPSLTDGAASPLGNSSGIVPGSGGASPPATGAPPTPLPPEAASMPWAWPTRRRSPPRPVPNGGILLLGEEGQDVRAAATGRVVYTGNGIRGYGNLIIIKHGDSLLTSYAHNRDVLVHEGQDVLGGQLIAHMGIAPHQVAALYFEVRVNGKPIDPLRCLPAP